MASSDAGVCDECLVAVYRPAWSNAASLAVCQGRPVVHEPKSIIEPKRGTRRIEELPSNRESPEAERSTRADGMDGIIGLLCVYGILRNPRSTVPAAANGLRQ